VCIIGYGLIDSAMIDANKRDRERRWEQERIQAEREVARFHQEQLDKIQSLVPKYRSSPLTSLLTSEIEKIRNGQNIHRINYDSIRDQLVIDGGSQSNMYIGDLVTLGRSSTFSSLGYKLPLEERGFHVVALLTAIAQKTMGNDYEMITHCDSDNGVIDSGCVLSKTLRQDKDLKSPV
jgi:hypothetical protein